LETYRSQLGAVSKSITIARAATVLTEGENARLKTELECQGQELQKVMAEMRAERQENHLLANQLREALLKLATHAPDNNSSSAELREVHTEQSTAESIACTPDYTVTTYPRWPRD